MQGEEHMKEEWLFPGAIVPVDVETTATLVAEIKRLIDVVGGMALAQPVQGPTGERAWFTIAELNAWADKKLSENPHWVMPKEEPERDELPPQRTFVGLTDEELDDLHRVLKIRLMGTFEIKDIYRAVEQQLKDKNT
jgi:hypothetical protein